jgi:glycosyltransferase involved in cell wall biosynthesis
MKSSSEQPTRHPVVGCTVASIQALPQAIVLARSFRQFHPEAEFVILIVGRPSQLIVVPDATVWGLGDLALAPGEEWRLPMLHRGRELVDLLRPAFLKSLLSRNAETVAWFECSTLLFAPLSSAELPDGDCVVAATEAIQNNFGDSGRSFIAVRSGAEPHLQVWFERAPQDSLDDKSLFDAVPHRVIASPTFAAAYWNLDPKSFASSPRGYEVSGQPLRSFDFRGYDPDQSHLLSKYQGLEPRILLSQYPAIAQFCDQYRDRLLESRAQQPGPETPFEFFADGSRIDQRMRRLYRDALAKFRRGETPEPPSPFGPAGEKEFLQWLNEPMTNAGSPVTRYMLAVREDREDVKSAFPDPLGTDAAAFRNWYHLFGRRELDLPSIVVPGRESRAAEVEAPILAVNIAGYFQAELGLGVAARSIVSALKAAEVPFNTLNFGATANRQAHPFAGRHTQDASDMNLVVVNPDQLSVFAEETGPALRHGRYTIGVWFWEVEDFPPAYQGAFNYVDEIWVASDFMRETFLKVSGKPVFKYVLPVEPPQIDSSLTRAALGLPQGFVFLFTFDLLSVLERKNPLGLIKAFIQAFPKPGGAVLVIKTINGDKRLLEMEKLRYAARGRSDIVLMDGYLSAVENNTLTALADCYVSLHRSEGFGLTLAEAMALAKPTIATAYSGNLEFMTANNSYLCPALRCKVGPDRDPYPRESFWSEPDIYSAAELLRHVYENPAEALARGRRGADDLRAAHSAQRAGALMREQLTAIRRRRQALAAFGT